MCEFSYFSRCLRKVKEVNRFCVKRRLFKMPGCFQASRCRKVEVQPESFCSCEDSNVVGERLPCSCGEELGVHEWAWDNSVQTSASRLILDGKEVHFHPGYSSGTAIVRGDKPCVTGSDYYWEIKVLTLLYGTDVMVGVCTDKVDLETLQFKFCSLLGSDEESWGYSYRGYIQHKGKTQAYGPPYGRGSIVGVHLDMWKGTIQFYLNRKPLGIAFTSLHGRTLYPALSSTAAKSAMKVIYSSSFPSTLQLLCFKSVSSNSEMMKMLKTIPYLKSQIENEYWWLTPPEGSARSAGGYREYFMMEVAENEEDYDSDEDEDGSLSSFCAYMSRTSNRSSQETVLTVETGNRRKRMSTREGTEIEPSLFHNHCDTEKSDDGTLSVNSKKLCIVCDVIV